MKLENVFKEDKLEEILVANWTQFLDSSKLLGFVLKNVKENINNLAVINSKELKRKGPSITLSRFYRINTGFSLWVEFHVPIDENKTSEGTMELYLSSNGIITYVTMTGNIYF
jgi:hypothetical protein